MIGNTLICVISFAGCAFLAIYLNGYLKEEIFDQDNVLIPLIVSIMDFIGLFCSALVIFGVMSHETFGFPATTLFTKTSLITCAIIWLIAVIKNGSVGDSLMIAISGLGIFRSIFMLEHFLNKILS